MSNNNLVSICIPSYNHGKFIKQTIESVLFQDYKNIELLIIDDGSLDNSIKIISELLNECQKRFVRFEFIKQKNLGLNKTLNKALAWSKGKYFSYLGSDDIILFNKITLLVKEFEEIKDKNLAGVFGSYEIIDQNNNKIYRKILNSKKINFIDIIKWDYDLNTPGQLLKLSLLKDNGGYKNDLYFEDWYMWLKLSYQNLYFTTTQQVIAKYRVHNDNMSKNIMKMHESRNKILEDYRDHKYYQYSMSLNFLYTAIDLTKIDKKKSLFFLFKSISHSLMVLMNKKFYFLIAKLLI